MDIIEEVAIVVLTDRAGRALVILGEGQAMRFLTPEEIATKELVSNAHMIS